MALQTSGQITFNDLHTEVGGSSGTSCSINDADIRQLIGKSSGQSVNIAEFYGASAGPQLQYTTTGTQYVAATSGKNVQPAKIYFFASSAAAMVNAMTGISNGYGFIITDYGYNSGNLLSGIGYILQKTTPGGGYQYMQQNIHSFSRSHGNLAGQHYVKTYYGSQLISTSNNQFDNNLSNYGLAFGNNSGQNPNISSSRYNASSWRLELYF